MLKTAVIGKTVKGATQLTNIMVLGGDRIVLVDATTGKPPKKVTTKMVNKDLHIFAEGASEPSVILNDYATFSKSVQISGMDSSGAYVNYAAAEAGSMELGATPVVVEAASAPIMSTSAWWGVGILAVAGGVAAAAGGGGGGDSSTTPPPVVVDPTAPTATITMSDVVLNTGETAMVTIVFSEAVTGFSNADVTAPNGTLSTFTSSDSITWTAIFTPTTPITDTTNVITLTAGSYTSTATSTAGAGATSANYEVDTTVSAPDPLTVTISDDQSNVANIAGTTVEYTFTFSEPVVSFSAAGITVTHGTAGTLQQQTTTVYKMLVTPDAGYTGDVIVNVAAGSATTSTSNSNLAAITSYQPVDMLAPTVVSVTLADSTLTIGETSAVTITFSEAVTGFDNADVSLAGAKGTLSTLTSSDNIVWTGLFTPTALTSDASNIIQILNTYADTAGNTGALGASTNFTIDTRVAPIAAPTFALTTDTAGVSDTDNITYTNGITVTLGSGITNWEYSLDGGSAWTTGIGTTFDLVENTSYAAGQIQVRQTDTNGNVSTIAANTQTTIVDTVGPVLTITDDESMATANMDGSNTDGSTDANGSDILYTFAFDEAVKDFTVADITVSSGATKGTFTKVSDTLYTLVVEPVAGFTGDITVGVLTSEYSDIAGNIGNAGSDTSSVQAVDMEAPLADALITADTGDQTITLTFDTPVDAVNMPGVGNFTVSTGYQSNAVAAVEVLGNVVTLHMTDAFSDIGGIGLLYADLTTDLIPAIQDLAGNDATSFSRSIADTLAPSLIGITLSDTEISSGETPTVTFTFSETVLGFDLTDIVADNATLGTLVSNEDGTVWTSILTPTINISDPSNTVHFSGGAAYTDQAANSGPTTATSVNYLVDTLAPVITTPASNVVGHTGTGTITLHFNEVLDAVNFAENDMFYVTDGTPTPDPDDGAALLQYTINAVSISGQDVTLTVDPSITDTPSATWILTYTDAPGNDTFALQDIYGSDVSSFTYSITTVL